VLDPERGVFRCRNASSDDVARRNPDGSIDYGYYRRRASALRRARITEASRRAARYVVAIVAAAIVAALVAAVTASGPQFAPDAGITNFGTAYAPLMPSLATGLQGPFNASNHRKP
jgi:hypothetical protein